MPVRYLLTGEEPDTATSFGPPRLATIAAKVLHDKLMGELRGIKAAAAAAASAAGGGKAGSDGGEDGGGGTPNSLQVARAAADRAAAAAERGVRRRWSWGQGPIRGSSGGGSGSGETSEGGAPPADASDDGALAAVERLLALPSAIEEAPAATVAFSPQLGAAPAASPRQRPEDAAQKGVEVDLQDPESPGSEAAEAAAGAVAGAGAAGRLSLQISVEGPDLEPPCAGQPGGDAGGSSDGGCDDAGAGEGGGADLEGKVSPHPELLEEGHGGFFGWCLSGADWGAGATANTQNSHAPKRTIFHPPSRAGPRVLNGLLRSLRRASSHRVAPTGHHRSLSGGSFPGDQTGVTCGICLDAAPATCVEPCKHVLCGECGWGCGVPWAGLLVAASASGLLCGSTAGSPATEQHPHYHPHTSS